MYVALAMPLLCYFWLENVVLPVVFHSSTQEYSHLSDDLICLKSAVRKDTEITKWLCFLLSTIFGLADTNTRVLVMKYFTHLLSTLFGLADTDTRNLIMKYFTP